MFSLWIHCLIVIGFGLIFVPTQSAHDQEIETNYIRTQRLAHENSGTIVGLFMTFVNIKKIYDEVNIYYKSYWYNQTQL